MKTNVLPGDMLFRDSDVWLVIGHDGTSFWYTDMGRRRSNVRIYVSFDCEATSDRFNELEIIKITV